MNAADHMVDILDEMMRHVGTAQKSEAHQQGLWHRSFHCWIVAGGSEPAVLFQHRSRSKDLFPNLLDVSAAGHYEAGEQIDDGVRELTEELGVTVPSDALMPLGIMIERWENRSTTHREFCHTFLLRDDRPLTEYRLQPEEVSGLFAIRISDGLALFSGDVKQIPALGIALDTHGRLVSAKRYLALEDFVPRPDLYYRDLFLTAAD
ncbi:MAG: NUDIX domain-containing protein [Micrococcales bacterium]|nr:NUDIX domain-containing protein [Micrococcales bacterium]